MIPELLKQSSGIQENTLYDFYIYNFRYLFYEKISDCSMITKVNFFTNSEEKKRLLSNFMSLSVLQGVSYALPLLTLPYLVRVLGIEYFGLLAFVSVIIAYCTMITDYGFNLTATREISIHRDNKEKIVEIFSAIMTIKIVLMIISFILMSILVFSFAKFSQHWEIYFLNFGVIIGQLLFPVWFFQGMEQMKYITYLNILSKLVFTGAIFIFVQEQNDYYLVPLLTSLGFVSAGIWSLIIVKKKFYLSFKFQNSTILIEYLKEGWYIFVSNIALSFYSSSAILLLGFFTNNTVVGYFSAFEKLVRGIAGLFTPLFQAFFPYIANKIKFHRVYAIKLLRKILIFTVISTCIIFLLSELYALELTELLFNREFNAEIDTFRWLLILIIILPLAYIIFNIILIGFNQTKYFSLIYIVGGLFSISLLLLLIYVYKLGLHGAVASVLLTELLTTIMGVFIIIRSKIFVKGNKNE